MNEVERAWVCFLDNLKSSSLIRDVGQIDDAGTSFIYLKKAPEVHERYAMERLLIRSAMRVMKGKRLTLSIRLVREDKTCLVYSIRFLVPRTKMFCCGNQCPDCIRFDR